MEPLRCLCGLCLLFLERDGCSDLGPLVGHRLGKELESRVVAVWVDKAIVEEVLSRWSSGRHLVTWCPRLPSMCLRKRFMVASGKCLPPLFLSVLVSGHSVSLGTLVPSVLTAAQCGGTSQGEFPDVSTALTSCRLLYTALAASVRDWGC